MNERKCTVAPIPPCPRCTEMHRRAQAAESFAIRFARQNSNEAAWRKVGELRYWIDGYRRRARLWKDRYSAVMHRSLLERIRNVRPPF